MRTFFFASQIAISIFLIVLILIQSRGSGLGRTFGGNSASFSRRGLERFLYKLTFIVAGLFIVISAASLFY